MCEGVPTASGRRPPLLDGSPVPLRHWTRDGAPYLLSHPGRGRDAVVAVGHRPFHGRLFDRESPPFSPMIVPAENDEANPLAPPAGECPSMSPPCFLACTYGSSSLHLPSSPAVRPAGRICMNGRRFNSEFVVNLRAAPIPWWSREVAS